MNKYMYMKNNVVYFYPEETCLFGDQPGEYATGSTCQSRITGDLSTCYNADFQKFCCASCEAAKLNIAGMWSIGTPRLLS